MTAQQLIDQIGDEGDALLKTRLRRVDDDGDYVPINQGSSRPVLLSAMLVASLERIGPGSVAIAIPALLFLAPIDLILVVVRFLLFPFVLTAWWLERRLARFLRRSFFCPLCSNPMQEPFVYCPKCKTVQPRLRPYPEALFWRTCECGATRWSILGQFLLRRPQPLVCRDTEHITGCYRPHPLASLAGTNTSRHIALAGSSIRSKHAVMAHLFYHLTSGTTQRGSFAPAWDMSELELELSEKVLYRAFRVDTSVCEKPGNRYTLSLSFVLRRKRSGELLAFHNLAQPWLESTPLLVKNVLNWKLIHGMIFVLDPEQLGKVPEAKLLPQVEIYSRILRVIEEYCVLPVGRTLPLQLAVLLPIPAGQAAALNLPGTRGELPQQQVQQLIRDREPGLHALLCRSIAPGKLRFFGGILPDKLDPDQSTWIARALEWLP
ncbi:MAG: hypothetical protein U0840_11130 [Gemmataceae bacterium]